MQLDPRSPALAVVQATISEPEHGRALGVGFSMPAAPFGNAGWQLPVLVGYMNRLRQHDEAPSAESFMAYMEGRNGVPVPVPQHPYEHAAWHDDRVSLLLDVAFTQPTITTWPGVSLVVQEQEPGRSGGCGWARTSRLRGTRAVLAYVASEVVAEHQRLSDRARTAPALRELRDLAGETARWVETIRRAYRADLTLTRAAGIRALIKH